MTRKFDFVYTCIHWSHVYGCFDIFKWKSRKGCLKQKQKHGSLILKYWKKNFPLNTNVSENLNTVTGMKKNNTLHVFHIVKMQY